MKPGLNNHFLKSLLLAVLGVALMQTEAFAQGGLGAPGGIGQSNGQGIGIPIAGGGGSPTVLPEPEGLPFFDNSTTADAGGVPESPGDNPFIESPADNPAATGDATGSSGGVNDPFTPVPSAGSANLPQTFDDDDFDDDDFDDDDFNDDDDDDGPGVLGVPGGGAAFAGDPRTDRRSLFGFFNTVVNDFNFLELVNLSQNALTGEVILIDFEGRESRSSFTVQPQRRADLELHAIVEGETFGHFIVTHNGRPGDLVGNVTQYSTQDGGELTFEASQPLERVFGRCDD